LNEIQKGYISFFAGVQAALAPPIQFYTTSGV